MPLPRVAEPRSLDDLLLYRLSHCLATAGSLVVRVCEGRYGITRREWRILALLAVHGAQRSSELADRAQLDRARTSRAVTSLLEKKMITRAVGTSDRRQALLALAPPGQRVYDELFPFVRELNGDLLAALQPGQVAALDGMLDALQARAEALVARHAKGLPKADRRRGRDRSAIG